MKKMITIILLLLFLIIGNRTAANPIAVYWISEFSIDSTGWKLELHSEHAWQDSVLLDGWCLISDTDTAYFKDGISFNPLSYLVITNDNLKSTLKINIDGDRIILCESNQGNLHGIDDMSFGRNISDYPIATPLPGESICKREDIYYYFDKTPTFGFENDTSNTKGFVEGYVKDFSGSPIGGVKVNSVSTDSNGYFKIRYYAQKIYLSFNKENYLDSIIVVQLYPDSTVKIKDINLITGVIEVIPPGIPKDFKLSQNFPNPFNSTTSFFYTLPEGDNVEISIYDEKGAFVQKLFSGYQPAGKYRVNWKTDNLASGIYIYRVRTGSINISKKAVLLK